MSEVNEVNGQNGVTQNEVAWDASAGEAAASRNS